MDLHDKLAARDRAHWWAQQALREQQSQMEILGRALPRAGGRVAPQLLDSLMPTEVSTTEAAMRNVIACLGLEEGLSGVLRFRGFVREAAVVVGPRTSAGFALERMDRRLQDLLSLWLSHGIVKVDVLQKEQSLEAWEDAEAVAQAENSLLAGMHSTCSLHHRCFVLKHPMIREDSVAGNRFLFCAHAAMLPSRPKTLNDIVIAPSLSDARVACFWSLGSPFPGECFRGLGLGRELFSYASQIIRKEIAALQSESSQAAPAEVCALLPLVGFTNWLRRIRDWDPLRGQTPAFVQTLQRALDTTRTENREVQFVDADGDSLHFRCTPATGLEVAIGGQSFQPVIRLRVAESEGVVIFLTGGDQGQALQVEAPAEAVSRGDLKAVEEMAEASGILPIYMRDPLLQLANDFYLRRIGSGKRVADPAAHFHLSSGASFGGLLWRADESVSGRAESLGIMATFVYDGVHEAEQAAAYTERGAIFNR